MLGKCRCGCNSDIPIVTTKGLLQRYKWRHSNSLFKIGHTLGFQKGEKSWMYGKKPPNYKGGHVNTQGYVMIFKPNHPNANNVGYVREHRLVMEEYLGRYLNNDEVVHHINGNKSDNRIENLELMTKLEHDKYHTKLQNNMVGINCNG